MRDRQTETERVSDRQTERERQRETDRHRQTEWQADREQKKETTGRDGERQRQSHGSGVLVSQAARFVRHIVPAITAKTI